MTNIETLKKELRESVKPGKKEGLMRFFKTGPGQYGEGDKFIGVMVPETRALVKKYWDKLTWEEVGELVISEYHEERQIGLAVLVAWYQKGTENEQKKIYEYYLKNYKYVNNWDLVDLSAPKIVGDYLDKTNSRDEVFELIKSDSLWMRRIGVLACATFIQRGSIKEIFKVAENLLGDKHDLIHKAVGWMLREAGKKMGNEKIEDFILKHVLVMPRTMLRYAIEKFPEEKRKKILDIK